MLSLDDTTSTVYRSTLQRAGVPVAYDGYYLKWLRYFFDFCAKYHQEDFTAECIRLFLDKLRSKGQSEAFCRQAAHAVSLYIDMTKNGSMVSLAGAQHHEKPLRSDPTMSDGGNSIERVRKSFYSEAGYQEKSSSPEWDAVLAAMADEIKVRHYSRKTFKTYALCRWRPSGRCVPRSAP